MPTGAAVGALVGLLLLILGGCSDTGEQLGTTEIVSGVLESRQLNDYGGLPVPVLAPPLPELSNNSALALEPLIEAVAVLAAADRIDTEEGRALLSALTESATEFRASDATNGRSLPRFIGLARALEMSGESSESVRSELLSWIATRGHALKNDDVSILILSDELQGLQFLNPPTEQERAALDPATFASICMENGMRPFREMFDIESFRNALQIAQWAGFSCDANMTSSQFSDANNIVGPIFESRLASVQAPLLNLNHAGWFRDFEVLTEQLADRALAGASVEVAIPSPEYDVGAVGYALVYRDSSVTVVLDRGGIEQAISHARGQGFFTPSEFPGELVLLADLNRILGRSLAIDAERVSAEDLDLRWALAAIPDSGVEPLSTAELEFLDGAENLGFTASLAAVRYLSLASLDEADRCSHATAVRLSGSRQLIWAVAQVAERCNIAPAPMISDPADGSALSAALIELDRCLGTEIPHDPVPAEALSEEIAQGLYVDELWAAVVRTFVEEGQCGLIIG